jgi:hypothetical protein
VLKASRFAGAFGRFDLSQDRCYDDAMSTVAEIIDAVRSLSEADKDAFLDQLRQVEFEDVWDRQMESDAKAGKLDFLVQEADEAVSRGTLRDWPGSQR